MWPFSKKQNATYAQPDDALLAALSNLSGSGASVTPDTALTQATVFSCIRVLSSTLAALPLHLMQQDGKNKEKALKHPLYNILHMMPNDEMTAFNFFQVMFVDVLTCGTGFAEFAREGERGAIKEIFPLDSTKLTVCRHEKTGKLEYTYREDHSTRVINPSRIWRITGFSDMRNGAGICGRPPLKMFKEAIGQALEGEKYVSSLLKNGGVSEIALKVAQRLNPDQIKEVREGWKKQNSGSKNAGNIPVLHNGAELTKVGASVADARVLEFLGIKAKDICGIFGVPPHLVGLESDVKYSNMEQQNLAFLVHGLLPYIRNGEQTIHRDLLVSSERMKYFAKFNVNALLRADVKTRGEFYRTLQSIGAVNLNEVRGWEDLNPVEGGEHRYMQTSMGRIDENGDIIGAKTDEEQPTGEPVPDEPDSGAEI